ncbi:MAG: ABC transporter substrate-binding protein [Vicinamibacterales bacterium]
MLSRLITLNMAVLTLTVSVACQRPDDRVIFALPATTLSATSAFVAEDLEMYRREGLNVTTRVVIGVAAPNAVLSGSADFTLGSGAVFLRAIARGEQFLAIANVIDRPMVEFVIRKDIAEQRGISDQLSLNARAARLRGLTIGVQGVGSVVHAWQRYVVHHGGLDVDRDVRIAPMDAASMLPAMRRHTIDGFVTSPPFTTQALVEGDAVMLASAVTDAPALLPFAYGLIYATPDTCRRRAAVCRGMARAFAAAARAIQDDPDDVFERVVRKRFPETPPDLLRAAWKTTRAAHATDVRVTEQQMINARRVSLEAELLDESSAPTSYRGLFTDAYLR